MIVQGEAGHFCAGGDIAEYADFRFEEPSLRAFHEDEVWGALAAMLGCDLPVVAQIEGNCMGAGVEIACCCDLRWASESARFGAPIAKLGFPMAPREAALVARVAGDATAREMLLAAQVLPAGFAAARLSCTSAMPAAELPAAMTELAGRMATLAPQAARMNKATLRRWLKTPVGHARAGTGGTPPTDYADSPEHREGM